MARKKKKLRPVYRTGRSIVKSKEENQNERTKNSCKNR